METMTLPLPQEPQSSQEEDVTVIPINQTSSDGDMSVWPQGPEFIGMADDQRYREKLAQMWLEKMGAYDKGGKYIIDSLPEGYALIDTPRGPNTHYRFLWGHPTGHYFNSTLQFFPHFYHLMTDRTSPCDCINCKKGAKRRDNNFGSSKGGRPRKSLEMPFEMPAVRPGRPVGRPGRPSGRALRPTVAPVVDREGTPDVFKMAVMELKEKETLKMGIEESASMDWRAERDPLNEYLEKLDKQPSFLPRTGEIVLWTPDFDGELMWNPDTENVQIYSPSEDRWLGTPEWRAGVIGQVPEEQTMSQDIVETLPKSSSINYSGFRVETFPDPLSPDKSYSLHYKYVYLKCIKPFNSYEVFLQGIPREKLHPSIEYAMTVMSSFSLLDKFRFEGTWPNASILCRGIFIGAELLIVGDAVRLRRPSTGESLPPPTAVDIMVIEEIRLDLINCNDDPQNQQLAEKYQVRVSGKTYTRQRDETNSSRTSLQPMDSDEVIGVFRHIGMTGYGDWYRVWDGFSVTVSQDMIIGRCYEPDALQLLFGSLDLTLDYRGVINGRLYSRQADERIAEGKTWFWGDFRTQTLAIDSLNGQDVGHYSDTRDVPMWRANLKVIDGSANLADIQDAKIPGERGRPKARMSFEEISKTSKLVSTGLTAADASNTVSSAEDEPGQGIEVDDDDDESSSEEEDFSVPIEQIRGGTESEDDYVPAAVPGSKRAKYESD